MDDKQQVAVGETGTPVGASLPSLSRLSFRGPTILTSALGVLAGVASRGTTFPTLTGDLPSWLTAFPDVPRSPNGRASSGVAAAKRLALKRKNQRKAKRSLRG